MRLVTTACRPGRTPRRAFTLIELLVVIAIISILMALSISAILKAVGTQQNSNTKTVVNKGQSVLADRWKAAIDDAYKISTNITGYENPNAASDILTLAGGDAKRARVLFVCYYLKQQFPISFAEVLLCTYDPATKTPQYYNPLGRNLAFNTKLTKTYNVAANTPPLLGESAAMLLIALERGTGGAGKTADVFGASSIRPFAFPTNANPAGSVDVPVLKDDWNTPLAFFRWSTADADLDGTLPIGSRSRNNLDPENKLIDANWFNVVVNGKTVINPNRVLFERSCYSLSDAKGNPYVYYITPVIVSAGTNTKFGIDLQTMAVNNQDDANDNVYSYRLKRE